jgi:hypothetical protein
LARSIAGSGGLVEAAGSWIGWSTWLVVDPQSVAAFCLATGEPESGTVPDAHVLALAGALVPTICRVVGRRHALNYGLDGVAIHRRLPVGGRMRIAVRLDHTAQRDVGLDTHWQVFAETDDPTCALLSAMMITRYVF